MDKSIHGMSHTNIKQYSVHFTYKAAAALKRQAANEIN